MTEAIKKGYKHTELGVIPKDWNVKKLGEIAKISRGASPRPIEDPIYFDDKSDIGWVRISDVTRSNKYLLNTEQKLSLEGIKKSRPVNKNNLIMSICATVGRPIITKIDVCIHDGFVVFDKLQENQEYTYYYLSSIENNWSKHGQTGSQMNLNTTLINNGIISLPKSSQEQSLIASVLSDTDALIESLNKLITKKKNIKQGAMQELLTGKRRLPGFKGEWDYCSFENTWQKLYPKSKISSGDGDSQGDFMLFVSGAENKRIDTVLYKNMEALIFSDGGIFNVRFFKGDFSVTDHCVTLNLNQSNGFYYYWLTLNQKMLDLQTFKGSGLRNLNKKELAKVEVPKPSLQEQSAIAQVLSDMDAEIEELEKKRDKYLKLKTGIMQQLLTGRIRLK